MIYATVLGQYQFLNERKMNKVIYIILCVLLFNLSNALAANVIIDRTNIQLYNSVSVTVKGQNPENFTIRGSRRFEQFNYIHAVSDSGKTLRFMRLNGRIIGTLKSSTETLEINGLDDDNFVVDLNAFKPKLAKNSSLNKDSIQIQMQANSDNTNVVIIDSSGASTIDSKESSLTFAANTEGIPNPNSTVEEISEICLDEHLKNQEEKGEIIIDVLVGYTTEAMLRSVKTLNRVTGQQEYSGTPSDIYLKLQIEMKKMNEMLVDSGIHHIKYNLKATKQLKNYSASRNTQLDDFDIIFNATPKLNGNDIEQLKMLYRTSNSDALILLTAQSTPEDCGRGALPTVRDTEDGQLRISFTPVSVVALNCFHKAVLQHELAHNMGATHNESSIAVGESAGLYKNSHGYIVEPFYKQTIMGVLDTLFDSNFNAQRVVTRVLQFSNPYIEVNKYGETFLTGEEGRANVACTFSLMAEQFSKISEDSTHAISNASIYIEPSAGQR
jgi:hypothetical protein